LPAKETNSAFFCKKILKAVKSAAASARGKKNYLTFASRIETKRKTDEYYEEAWNFCPFGSAADEQLREF
jgi:hypothetical protein